MSLILKKLLEASQWNHALFNEYTLYLSWIKPSFLSAHRENGLSDQYHFWNGASGHSRGLLRNQGMMDRDKILRPLMPWKVALNSLRSGYNVGSIIRTSDAFGFSEIIMGGTTPSAENRAVKSAAMRSEIWVKQSRVDDLAIYFQRIRKGRRFQIIGLEIAHDSLPIQKFNFPDSGLLVIGNEETGLGSKIQKLCHQLVYVPMFGRKHSLNVAAAFAITAHHIRQVVGAAVHT